MRGQLILERFWRLSGAEKRAVIEAFECLALARVSLSLFPVVVTRGLMKRLAAGSGPGMSRLPPERLIWAVEAVSNRIPPFRNCLVRALTAWVVLSRSHYPSKLKIGVTKNNPRLNLQAHAWLEFGGRIVIGGAQSPQNYAPLSGFEDIFR